MSRPSIPTDSYPESLPEASAAQLDRLDDVCAICYQEMKTAKITRCNHFFHGVCLRKWLYVQDRCPLCHDILYKMEVETKEEEGIRGTGVADPLLIPPLPADDNHR